MRFSKKSGYHFLLGFTLIVLLSVILLQDEPLSVKAAAIDPAVYDALKTSVDGQATFILYFDEQADLSEAERIADWAERGQYVYDQLRAVAARSQLAVQAQHTSDVIPGRVTEFQAFWIANAVVVTGDRTALEHLARQPNVAQVLPEMKYNPPELPDEFDLTAASEPSAGPEWGIAKINADKVWDAPFNSRGEGVVIGVIDTGVQWDHPALIGQYRGWDEGSGTVDHNYNWFNPEPENTCEDSETGTCDWHGHGTHTTGTTSGGDGGVNQIGVAPGAKWIHALGCCPSNQGGLRTMQWMLAPTDLQGQNPNPALRPHVINNSWGGPGGSLIFNDIMSTLKASGIMVVFSAGNNGSACGTLGSPGDNPPVFNVGSTDQFDFISTFSSRGPNPFTGETGPAVAAPGSRIRSSYPDSTYGFSSGTSMAAPHVVGAAALLMSVEPDLVGKIDQIEALLRGTAIPLTSPQSCGNVSGDTIPNNTYGSGRIDVQAAADMIRQAGTFTGNVKDIHSDAPIANATLFMMRDGHTLHTQTDKNGDFELLLGAGDYDVNIAAFGYPLSRTFPVSIEQDQTNKITVRQSQLPTGELFGQVLMPAPAPDSYAPIAGATVKLLGVPTGFLATTNANGEYAIAQVPQGDYAVEMSAPGFENSIQTVNVVAGTELDFIANPAIDYVVGDGGDSCSAAFDWIDATAGDAYELSDDDSTLVELPFTFVYYGNSYDRLHISSNGFISFGNGYNKWHGVIPFVGPPNNAIYGLGEDLNPAGGDQGMIYTKLIGDDRFVIEYHQVEHWSSGNPETFEIILDASDNSILMQYQQVSWPEFANVGIENSDGSHGVSYSYANQPPLTPGLAVKYTPFLGLAPECEPTMMQSWLPWVLH
jgi:hypothetical protein